METPGCRFLNLLCATALLAFASGSAPAHAGVEPTPFLEFSVLQSVASGSPYPTSPILIDVRVPIPPPDPAIPVEILALSLRSARSADPPDPVLPIDIGTTDRFGQHVKIDFVLGLVPDDGLPDSSFFDVFFDVRQHPDSRVAPVLGIDPTPFTPGSSFFDVFFDVTLDGIGTVHHLAHFETLQPLAFSGVNVTGPQSPAFGASFTLDRTGGALDPSNPLFSLTITGNAVPAPGTLALLAIACAALASRRRWPPHSRSGDGRATGKSRVLRDKLHTGCQPIASD
jgi:hypothetical protein